MLIAKDINKAFRKGTRRVYAVKGVNLSIEKGERIYIHGPSGAGKSSLLHMLGGLSRPTGGKIVFNGRDIYRLNDRERSSARNRAFGFVFQFYYLLPELSVLENVMLPAMIRKEFPGRKIKERAVEIIKRVSMSDRLRHRPGELSGGETQRVAIARALINAPDIILCDEPTGNLDSVMSSRIYDLILDISRENSMSVVIISHQEAVKGFFNTSYYMKDGVLESSEVGCQSCQKSEAGCGLQAG